jgi:hypothetical protein
VAGSDSTKVAFIYKKRYSDEKVGKQTKRDHLLAEMASFRTGMGGEDFRYVVRTGNPQGVSGDFATAQAGASGSKGAQFAATVSLKYGVITLDGPSMARARGNDDSFFDLVTMETDGIIEEVGDSLAFDAYRDGSGNRGQIATGGISGNVVTLANPDDARNFKRGMLVVADDSADGLSLRDSGDSAEVTSVDVDAGTITLNAVASIAGLAAGDYLFRKGDPGTCSQGLSVLLPLTAPSSGESFRGVDRSVDTRKLAGCRLNDTSATIEENMGLVGVKIRQEGKKANCGFLNPINFWTVVRRQNAKVEFQGAGGTADYGFEYFMIHTPAGSMKVYSDPDCPTNRGYVGNLESLQCRHIDPYPHVIRDDGRPNLRQTGSDGLEARIRSMHNWFLLLPGQWGVFAI